MPYKQQERAIEAWKSKRVAIDKARAVRAQPPAAPSVEDSDEEDTSSSHKAASPGLAAAAQGVTPCIPAMPVTHDPDQQPHREKWSDDFVGRLAAVTRQLHAIVHTHCSRAPLGVGPEISV